MSYQAKIKDIRQLTFHYFLIVHEKDFEVYYTNGLKKQMKIFAERVDKTILKVEISHDVPKNRVVIMLFYHCKRVDVYIASFNSNNYLLNIRLTKQTIVKPLIDDQNIVDIDFNYMYRCVIIGPFRIICTFNFPNEDSRNHSVYYINMAPETTKDTITRLRNIDIVPISIYFSEQQPLKICGLKNCIGILEDKFNVIKFIRYNLHKNLIGNEDNINKTDTYIIDFKAQPNFEYISLDDLAVNQYYYEKYKEVYDKCVMREKRWVYNTYFEDIVASTTNDDAVFIVIEKGVDAGFIVCSIDPKGIIDYVPGSQFKYIGGLNKYTQISLVSESSSRIKNEGDFIKESYDRDFILSYGSEYNQLIKLISYKVSYFNEYIERPSELHDLLGSKSSSLGTSIGYKFKGEAHRFIPSRPLSKDIIKPRTDKEQNLNNSVELPNVKNIRMVDKSIIEIPEESREQYTNTNWSNMGLFNDNQKPIGFEAESRRAKHLTETETADRTKTNNFGKKTVPDSQPVVIYNQQPETNSVKDMVIRDDRKELVFGQISDKRDIYLVNEEKEYNENRLSYSQYRFAAMNNRRDGHDDSLLMNDMYVRKKITQPTPYIQPTKLNLSKNFERSFLKIKKDKQTNDGNSLMILKELDKPETKKAYVGKLSIVGSALVPKKNAESKKMTLDSVMFSKNSELISRPRTETPKFVVLSYGEISLPGNGLRKLNIVRESDIEKRLNEQQYVKTEKDFAKEAEKENFRYPFIYIGLGGLSPVLQDQYFIFNEFSLVIDEKRCAKMIQCEPYQVISKDSYNFKKKKNVNSNRDTKKAYNRRDNNKQPYRKTPQGQNESSSPFVNDERNSSTFAIDRTHSNTDKSSIKGFGNF